ncbi:TBC1 domain family member 23 [Hondaea fermentalgiana]|uniref:TBC1 domain family member 23 n=1 Tax=Hondaea fermentalgiana TaxID=2315210 RepID=A0A2R5GE11_9STRA|nr:TBC1 domain family member 23 [Hondaea fermentalgiana]|eukprot:GBG29182.1 TBC1 domain family member 23 [Hondaea fermentalgiana]
METAQTKTEEGDSSVEGTKTLANTMEVERKWTEAEVAEHDSPEACLVIVHGRVYNLTEFAEIHPGGTANITWHAGSDATKAFEEQGHGEKQLHILQKFCVGVVTSVPTLPTSRRPSISSLPREHGEMRRRGSVDSLSIRGGGESVGRRSVESFATSGTSTSKKLWTQSDIEAHDKPRDAWIALEGKVYDVTEFADKHPGGSGIITWNAGTDATQVFREQGHGYDHIQALERYFIGYLNLNTTRRRSSLLSSESDSKMEETKKFLESVRAASSGGSSDNGPQSPDEDHGENLTPSPQTSGSLLGQAQQPNQDVTPEDRECLSPIMNSWTPQEVSEHDRPDDAWVIVEGRVYDVTEFASIHPGGAANIAWQAGMDGTAAFREQGHGQHQLQVLEKYCVGRVCQTEASPQRQTRRKSDELNTAGIVGQTPRRASTGAIGEDKVHLRQSGSLKSVQVNMTRSPSGKKRLLSMTDVAAHDRPKDAWVAIQGRVYDLTHFAAIHPGGESIIQWQAGCDATGVFREQGHGNKHIERLQEYCIGHLNMSFSSRRHLPIVTSFREHQEDSSSVTGAEQAYESRRNTGLTSQPTISENISEEHGLDADSEDAGVMKMSTLATSRSLVELGSARKEKALAQSASATTLGMPSERSSVRIRSLSSSMDASQIPQSPSGSFKNRLLPIPVLDPGDLEAKASLVLRPSASSIADATTVSHQGSFATQSTTFILDGSTLSLASMQRRKLFTPEMVQEHDKTSDCYVIVEGKVYDLTAFADEHPGGAASIHWHAGADATSEFREQGHTEKHIQAMSKYCVSQLNLNYSSKRRLNKAPSLQARGITAAALRLTATGRGSESAMSTVGNETESPVEAGRDAEEEQVDAGEHEGGSNMGQIDAGSSAEGLVAADPTPLLLGTESKDRFLLDDSIRDTKQDLENQRVIRVDAQRTRADVEIFRTEEMQLLVSRLLTFYCKRKGIKYKQGLNEVLAPFIMLRRDPPLPDGTVFNMFYAFIERFLPHSFVHEDFHALQCSFRLFRLLLLYHDPELCNFLDTHSLSPELYATPWFLTLFARNVPLKVLYQLWDTYLLEEEDRGPHLHMFVALALTLENRTGILETHPSDLPIYLTSVLGPNATSPNTAAEDLAQSTPYLYDSSWMAQLIVRARKLRAHTPTHFTETFSRALLSPKLPTLAFLERLENQSCLHMSASQLLGLVTNRDRMRDENEFIVRVVDCRSREDFEQEHVIGSLHLDPELLNLPDLLSEAMESLADRLQLTDLSLHLVVVGPSSACSPTPSPSVTPTSFAEGGGLERSRANSGMAPDLTVAPAEEDQSAVLFVLHAIQRTFSKVSILEGGWDAVARDPEVGAVLESGASIDELVDPDVLRQKTRAPIHTWRESGMETLRGALSMDSFGSVTEPSAGSASAGQNASRKAASGSSPSWYQQLSSRIGDAAPLGALFSTSSISSTSSASSQVPGDTEDTDVASSKGDDTTSPASARLTNTPKVSDPSTRKQMQRDQDGANSAGAAADGTAPKIASAASAFVSRVANRYFTKTSEGAAKANSKAGPKDLLELALLAHDSESQWLDIEEWTSQTEGSGVDARIFAAARLTLDLDGCKRSTECTLAVTKSRLVELRAHPDRSSFACVQEVHEISRLIKITSKKKRREIVFHFKVGPNGVKQRSFIIEKAGECIDIVKRRFSDLSQPKPRTK